MQFQEMVDVSAERHDLLCEYILTHATLRSQEYKMRLEAMEASFRDLVTEKNAVQERIGEVESNREQVSKKLEERTGKQQSVVVGVLAENLITTQLTISFSQGHGRRASSCSIEPHERTRALDQANRQVQR